MSLLIGDVADVFNGKTPSKAEQREAGFPVLKIKDVDALGQFRGSMESFVDHSFADAFRSKHLQTGDTLILNAAHNSDYVASKTFFAHESHGSPLVTGEWTIVRPRPEKAVPAYVRHYIESQQAKRMLKEMVNGIHLYPKDVARLSIPVPPLPEQRRIAAILDKADTLRAKRRLAIGKLDQLLQSVFLEMFGDPVTNPKGFRTGLLGDFIAVGPSNGLSKPPEFLGSGIPLLDNKAVYRGMYADFADQRLIDVTDAEFERFKVEPGDIMFNRVSVKPEGVGVAALAQQPPNKCVFESNLIRVRLMSELDPVFSISMLRTEGCRRYVLRSANIANQASISQGVVRSIPIILPSADQQKRFAAFVAQFDSQKRMMARSQDSAAAMFYSLQQRAFAGH